MTGMFPPSPTPTPPQELLWLLENPKPLLPFSFCPLQFVQNIYQQGILVGLPCTEPRLLLTTLFSWHVGATWAWWPQWQVPILRGPSTLHRIFQKQLLLSVWKLKLQVDPLLSQSFQIGHLFCFLAHLQNRDAPGCRCSLPTQVTSSANPSVFPQRLWWFICGGRTVLQCRLHQHILTGLNSIFHISVVHIL